MKDVEICECKCGCNARRCGDGGRGTPVRTWIACFNCGMEWLENARKHGQAKKEEAR